MGLLPSQPEQYMSLKRLAKELQMDRSACRRWMLKQGIDPVRRRTGDSGFQIALTVTMDQVARLKKIRADEGYLRASAVGAPHEPDISMISDRSLLAELRRRLDFSNNEDL